jgi:hypothetical protein
MRIEALNHALRGLPERRIRYHLCWGSWHGPHAFDIELNKLVDLMLRNVMAGADCGFGGRCHPQIACAKLQALVQGAELAVKARI